MSEPSNNPYAAPLAASSSQLEPTEAEDIRRKYLSHEASVKSIGMLYILGAFLMIPLSLGIGAMSLQPDIEGTFERALTVGIALVYLAIGIAQGATGVGIRRLRPWARWAAVALSAIGLLGFPIGTLISAYFLYLLLSKKGQMVFSPEYQQVIAETPHIKYRTSLVVIILLILLLVVMGVGITAALFS